MITTKFRSKGFWIGVIGILYMLITQFIQIDESLWNMIANLVAAILVAFGIFSDTDGEQHKITKEFLLEKLKSPIAVGAIFALLYYVIEILFGVNALSIGQNVGSIIMLVLFGGATYNNPNSRDTV